MDVSGRYSFTTPARALCMQRHVEAYTTKHGIVTQDSDGKPVVPCFKRQRHRLYHSLLATRYRQTAHAVAIRAAAEKHRQRDSRPNSPATKAPDTQDVEYMADGLLGTAVRSLHFIVLEESSQGIDSPSEDSTPRSSVEGHLSHSPEQIDTSAFVHNLHEDDDGDAFSNTSIGEGAKLPSLLAERPKFKHFSGVKSEGRSSDSFSYDEPITEVQPITPKELSCSSTSLSCSSDESERSIPELVRHPNHPEFKVWNIRTRLAQDMFKVEFWNRFGCEATHKNWVMFYHSPGCWQQLDTRPELSEPTSYEDAHPVNICALSKLEQASSLIDLDDELEATLANHYTKVCPKAFEGAKSNCFNGVAFAQTVDDSGTLAHEDLLDIGTSRFKFRKATCMLKAPKVQNEAPKEETKRGYEKLKNVASPINTINDSSSMIDTNLQQSSFMLDMAETKPLMTNSPLLQRSSSPGAPMMINTMSSNAPLFHGGIMGLQKQAERIDTMLKAKIAVKTSPVVQNVQQVALHQQLRLSTAQIVGIKQATCMTASKDSDSGSDAETDRDYETGDHDSGWHYDPAEAPGSLLNPIEAEFVHQFEAYYMQDVVIEDINCALFVVPLIPVKIGHVYTAAGHPQYTIPQATYYYCEFANRQFFGPSDHAGAFCCALLSRHGTVGDFVHCFRPRKSGHCVSLNYRSNIMSNIITMDNFGDNIPQLSQHIAVAPRGRIQGAYSGPKCVDHPHQRLSLLRANQEDCMVQQLGDHVSVGDNGLRSRQRLHRVHSLCPDVIDSDCQNKLVIAAHYVRLTGDYYVCNGINCASPATMLSNTIANGFLLCQLHSLCTHKLEECDCMFDQKHNASAATLLSHFSSFVFTHSFYYIENNDLARLKTADRVVVIAHQFLQPTTSHYEGEVTELEKRVEGVETWIHFKVGGHETFDHKQMIWSDGGRHQVTPSTHIAYRQIFAMHDSKVWFGVVTQTGQDQPVGPRYTIQYNQAPVTVDFRTYTAMTGARHTLCDSYPWVVDYMYTEFTKKDPRVYTAGERRKMQLMLRVIISQLATLRTIFNGGINDQALKHCTHRVYTMLQQATIDVSGFDVFISAVCTWCCLGFLAALKLQSHIDTMAKLTGAAPGLLARTIQRKTTWLNAFQARISNQGLSFNQLLNVSGDIFNISLITMVLLPMLVYIMQAGLVILSEWTNSYGYLEYTTGASPVFPQVEGARSFIAGTTISMIYWVIQLMQHVFSLGGFLGLCYGAYSCTSAVINMMQQIKTLAMINYQRDLAAQMYGTRQMDHDVRVYHYADLVECDPVSIRCELGEYNAPATTPLNMTIHLSAPPNTLALAGAVEFPAAVTGSVKPPAKGRSKAPSKTSKRSLKRSAKAQPQVIGQDVQAGQMTIELTTLAGLTGAPYINHFMSLSKGYQVKTVEAMDASAKAKHAQEWHAAYDVILASGSISRTFASEDQAITFIKTTLSRNRYSVVSDDLRCISSYMKDGAFNVPKVLPSAFYNISAAACGDKHFGGYGCTHQHIKNKDFLVFSEGYFSANPSATSYHHLTGLTPIPISCFRGESNLEPKFEDRPSGPYTLIVCTGDKDKWPTTSPVAGAHKFISVDDCVATAYEFATQFYTGGAQISEQTALTSGMTVIHIVSWTDFSANHTTVANGTVVVHPKRAFNDIPPYKFIFQCNNYPMRAPLNGKPSGTFWNPDVSDAMPQPDKNSDVNGIIATMEKIGVRPAYIDPGFIDNSDIPSRHSSSCVPMALLANQAVLKTFNKGDTLEDQLNWLEDKINLEYAYLESNRSQASATKCLVAGKLVNYKPHSDYDVREQGVATIDEWMSVAIVLQRVANKAFIYYGPGLVPMYVTFDPDTNTVSFQVVEKELLLPDSLKAATSEAQLSIKTTVDTSKQASCYGGALLLYISPLGGNYHAQPAGRTGELSMITQITISCRSGRVRCYPNAYINFKEHSMREVPECASKRDYNGLFDVLLNSQHHMGKASAQSGDTYNPFTFFQFTVAMLSTAHGHPFFPASLIVPKITHLVQREVEIDIQPRTVAEFNSVFDTDEFMNLPARCTGLPETAQINGTINCDQRPGAPTVNCSRGMGLYQTGPILTNLPLTQAGCVCNLLASRLCRHQIVQPGPTCSKQELEEFLDFATNQCAKLVYGCDTSSVEQIKARPFVEVAEEYIAGKNGFTRSKKADYRKELALYESGASLSALSKIEMFCKREQLTKSSAPRGIQTRLVANKVLTSPYIAAAEALLKQTDWYIGHLDDQQKFLFLGTLFPQDSSILTSDFAKFDSTQTQLCFMVECIYLEMLYGSDFANLWWANVAEINYGEPNVKRSFKFKLVGTKMSGESTTSLGNSLVNKFLTQWVLSKQGVLNVISAVSGDDSNTLLTTPIDLELVQQWYMKFGLSAVCDIVPARDSRFLSKDFYYLSSGLVGARILPKTLLTLPFSTSSRHRSGPGVHKQEQAHAMAKAIAFLLEMPGFDLSIAYYFAINRLTQQRFSKKSLIKQLAMVFNYNTLMASGWDVAKTLKRIPNALRPNAEFSAAIRDKYPQLDIDRIITVCNGLESLCHRSYEFSVQFEYPELKHNALDVTQYFAEARGKNYRCTIEAATRKFHSGYTRQAVWLNILEARRRPVASLAQASQIKFSHKDSMETIVSRKKDGEPNRNRGGRGGGFANNNRQNQGQRGRGGKYGGRDPRIEQGLKRMNKAIKEMKIHSGLSGAELANAESYNAIRDAQEGDAGPGNNLSWKLKEYSDMQFGEYNKMSPREKAMCMVYLRKMVNQKLLRAVIGGNLPSNVNDQAKIMYRIMADSPFSWLKEKAWPWIKERVPQLWNFAKGFLPNSMSSMVDALVQPHHIEEAEHIQGVSTGPEHTKSGAVLANNMPPANAGISLGPGMALGSGFNPSTYIVQPSKNYMADCISDRYLSSVINPTKGGYRCPPTFPIQTAIAANTTAITLTTNSNGDAFCYIFPDNVISSGNSTSSLGGQVATPTADAAFMMFSTQGTYFTPETGFYDMRTGAGPSMTSGCLYTSLSSFQQITSGPAQVLLTPVVQTLQDQGSVYMVYTQRPFNQTCAFQTATALMSTTAAPFIFGAVAVAPQAYIPQITTTQMLNCPYRLSSAINKNTRLRMVRIPTNSADDLSIVQPGAFQPGFTTSDPINECFYIMVTGAAPNTKVLRIEYQQSCEFLPTPPSYATCQVQAADPGVRTKDCMVNIFSEMPSIQHASQTEADAASNAIALARPETHDAMMQVLTQCVFGRTTFNTPIQVNENLQEALPMGEDMFNASF